MLLTPTKRSRKPTAKAMAVPEEEEESSGPDEDPQPRPGSQSSSNGSDNDGEGEDDYVDGSGGNGSEDEDENVDAEGLEEEDEQPEVLVPQKRKKVSQRAIKNKVPRVAQNEAAPNDDDDEEIAKISFTISAFSLEEQKKSQARRKPESSLLELPSNMAWIDAKARFKIIVSDLLFPDQAVVADNAFKLTWAIPRIQTNPVSLKSEADYNQLIKKALQAKNPAARILVDEVENDPNGNKENRLAVPAQNPPHRNNGQAPKKAKSKARKEADILPGNVAMNDQIRYLRERWECNLTTCHSELCFIPPDGPHFPLGHDHVQKWAAAILRGPIYATLEAPPNIKEFDPVSTHAIVTKSPVLQARLNAMAKEKGPAPHVVNVVLPNNAYGYQPVAPVTHPYAAPTSTSLILPTYVEGPEMDIERFCLVYNLPSSIQAHFRESAITGTHAFAEINSTDLKEMGFKLGEIIDLKRAIGNWVSRMD